MLSSNHTDLSTGLSSEQVLESRRLHGGNVITPQKDHAAWELFVDKFRDPMIRILLFAAVLSLIIGAVHGDFTESIGIICAVILATCVGFWFEWDAQKRFRSLNKVHDFVESKVLRDGKVCSVPRCEIVVGDVVMVETGETVPADGDLVEAVSLKMNESTLTGEPETDKTINQEDFDQEATYPSNRLLRGTSVIDGYGKMLVDAVGDASEAGRVTEQATVQNDEPTPLNRQLDRLAQWVGRVGIGVAVAIFCVMLLKSIFWGNLFMGSWMDISQQFLHIFMISVAIIVMSVPEGLPMSITLSLAMSMRRMLKTNNLVRKMHACETMGAVTVICTDKTGTLTRNQMMVQEMISYDELSKRSIAEMIALNTTAFLDSEGHALGNPTEGALLEWCLSEGEDYVQSRRSFLIRDRLTFSTERKFMATLYERELTGRRILAVKGAPEVVRAMCQKGDYDAHLSDDLLRLQNRAMRTLALAWVETPEESCEAALKAQKLKFSTVVAISDPVREEVPQAVKECLDAGIQVKIVTGDTVATAREIARQIGLWTEDCSSEKNAMTGTEFASMDDEALLERLPDLKILSRARPLDKQRLVKLLQRQGEVVAVTGDGTNDAPALNFANVGLSMGSGTSVAKDASDITLLDDSFSSIVTAVLWGRSLYRNIQRFILFQLTVNFVAIIVCFIGAVFGTDMPLTVVQILWVNIIMDTFAAMAMASLPPAKEVMQDAPRQRNEFIISKGMARSILTNGLVMTVVLLGVLFAWSHDVDSLTVRELTLFFTIFVLFQFWNMFNAKAFECHHSIFTHWKGCREFVFVLGAILLGQWAVVEWGGEIFRTEPLAWSEWALIFISTSAIALIGEVARSLRRKH